MKFCSLLRETAEEIPEIQQLHDCYKHLKKTLKRAAQSEQAGEVQEASRLQSEFVTYLKNCIEEINERFMEQEEMRVIEMGRLEEQASAAHDAESCREVTHRFANFHGQMLLFMHSAMLSYTAVLKILKKYTKKTGNQLEEFSGERLRSLPICATEITSSIVRRAESAIDALIASQARFRSEGAAPSEPTTAQDPQNGDSEDVSTLLGQVKVALYTWEQLKNTAATPSTVLANHLAAFSVPSVSASASVSSHSSSVKTDST